MVVLGDSDNIPFKKNPMMFGKLLERTRFIFPYYFFKSTDTIISCYSISLAGEKYKSHF